MPICDKSHVDAPRQRRAVGRLEGVVVQDPARRGDRQQHPSSRVACGLIGRFFGRAETSSDVLNHAHLRAGPTVEIKQTTRRSRSRSSRLAWPRRLFAVLLTYGSAQAADAPSDPHGFTAYVAAQFRKALPDIRVDTVGDLELKMTAPGRGWSVSLGNLHDACRRDRADCAASIEDFVANASALFHTPQQQNIDRSALRVVLRPTEYVDSLRSQMGNDPVATPVEGNFWMVGAIDLPTSIQPIDKKTLELFHLTPDEAFAIAKDNMAPAMRVEIQGELKLHPDGIVLMKGDDYEASLFAFPDLWAPLAQSMDGNLLVAVPSPDIMVFEDGRNPTAAEEVAGTAQIVMKHSDKIFSADVFRWTPNGWEAMPESAEQQH